MDEQVERSAFEVAELQRWNITGQIDIFSRPEGGKYQLPNIEQRWQGWKMRAQLAAPVAEDIGRIRDALGMRGIVDADKIIARIAELEQLAAPADLVRRLLEDHQRVEPHHADQCELCREATAAIEGQSNSHQIAVKQPAPGERQPSMIASAVYTASGKVFIGSSEE